MTTPVNGDTREKLSATRQELHILSDEVSRIREKQEEFTEVLHDIRADLRVHMALHAEDEKLTQKKHSSGVQWGTAKLLAGSSIISTILSVGITHYMH